MLRSIPTPVVVVVINNNGCNIFSFLPIAQFESVFEKNFITPHNLTFEKAAELFELPYSAVTSRSEFIGQYSRATRSAESCVIEVSVDRRRTVEIHAVIADAIRAKLGN